jgi:hypothetical protein
LNPKPVEEKTAMSGAFVICNQQGHYWGKSGQWVTGAHGGQVALWDFHDEAINTLFELGSKDTELRGEVLSAQTENGKPKNLTISEHPLPKIDAPVTETPLEIADDDPTD